MATHSFVEVDLPQAAMLEGLTGISYDLRRAQAFAQRLKAVSLTSREDRELTEPLWIAAVVQYFRAFGGGVRQNLNELLLSSLSGEQRELHNWFYEVRGRHIVHSVNTFEKSQTIARYIEEEVADKGITSIECNHSRVIGPGSQDIDRLIELSETILSAVTALASREKARLLTAIREMPLDQLLSRSGRGAHQPDMDHPEKSRS
jgi:hypothetical protein